MKDLLKNPEFAEALDMIHKQYIDQMYHNAGKQPPVPESLIPLSYADAKIQKGSLPHRQLRRMVSLFSIVSDRSLPHRQLRSRTPVKKPRTPSSLPHRQLRRNRIDL